MLGAQHRRNLEVLKQLLRVSGAGEGRLVLVTGGLASGKTGLLHSFARIAEDHGALVLRATAARGERSFQAGVVKQLLHAAGALSPAQLVGQRHLHLGGRERDIGTVTPAEAEVVELLSEVLLEAASECAVVLAVDDVHFADRFSLEVLLHVARRLPTIRILMVLSEWERPDPTIPYFDAEITRLPHKLLRLAPLTAADVAQFLAGVMPSDGDTGLASAYHWLSGGNALLVQALAEDSYGLGGRYAEGSSVGPAFAQAVLGCVHRWEPDLLEVVRALAVLGELGDPHLVGSLSGIEPTTAEHLTTILTTGGLLADGRFRSSVAREAVLGGILAGERSRLHLRAAELLHQQGAAAAGVASLLLDAGRTPEPWAVPVLREAAEQALSADDMATAVRCLELAHSCAGDDAERFSTVKLLARVLWRRNPSAVAPFLPPLRQAMADGALPPAEAALVIRHDLWNGEQDAVAAALGTLSTSSDPIAAQLRIACQWFYGPRWHEPDASRLTAWDDAARNMYAFWTQGKGEVAAESAEHVLRSCRLGETVLEVAATALLTLAGVGRSEEAIRWCERLIEQASDAGAVTWQALLGAVRADIACRQGEVVLAAHLARAALDMLSPRSWGVLVGYPRSILVAAHTAAGRHDEAAALLREPVPDAMFDTLIGLGYLNARGHHFLATDGVLAAISDFQTCGRRMQEEGFDVAMIVPWRLGLAQANLRLGRNGVARELAREQLNHPGHISEHTRGGALLVLAAAGKPAQRLGLLRQAVACLRSAGDRLLLARAMTELSKALQDSGERHEARLYASYAVRESRECFENARQREPDRGACDWDLTVLSDSEARVAELAALGHTNREISRKLYITVSTVEQHLTRIYRKLGVKSRVDLARPGKQRLRSVP
ncbi:LuxR C-terminal-related transcriptional regulator [Spongiactinospora sp. 9N601]|uniref:LuxR C-terminal-related transcriptional regulator n=1 Tax=Spongiactinospora sp. 9N601 TaxID=3375149 RepID=UPI0037A869D3